jgi:hypothetical protein
VSDEEFVRLRATILNMANDDGLDTLTWFLDGIPTPGPPISPALQSRATLSLRNEITEQSGLIETLKSLQNVHMLTAINMLREHSSDLRVFTQNDVTFFDNLPVLSSETLHLMREFIRRVRLHDANSSPENNEDREREKVDLRAKRAQEARVEAKQRARLRHFEIEEEISAEDERMGRERVKRSAELAEDFATKAARMEQGTLDVELASNGDDEFDGFFMPNSEPPIRLDPSQARPSYSHRPTLPQRLQQGVAQANRVDEIIKKIRRSRLAIQQRAFRIIREGVPALEVSCPS